MSSEPKVQNVLSLFDGIGGARLALDGAKISFEEYYASEIDKNAIKVSMDNFPDIIQLGDIKNWREWELDGIDLIVGGSPCQGFSLNGKKLNFDDPKSKLFFEFVDIVNHYKPKYFLLENVKMRKDIQEAISDILGVEPILINSGLVSAQNRERLYWTNIPNIVQPIDEGIFLTDVIDVSLNESEFIEGELEEYFKHKEGKMTSRGLCHIGTAKLNGMDSIKRVYRIDGKSPTLQTSTGGNRESKIAIGIDSWRKLTPLEYERLQTFPDNYTQGIPKTQRYNVLGNGFTVKVIQYIFESIQ